MRDKKNHTSRITFRVTPEEYAALRFIASRDGFGTVSSVVRTLLECRLRVLMDIAESGNTGDGIGGEIRDMFSNYESDGGRMQYPSDINGRK